MRDRLACPCCGINGCTTELGLALAELERTEGPQQITSGFRCKKHQEYLRHAWIRGRIEWSVTNPGEAYHVPEPALHSQHSSGMAIDRLCPFDEQPGVIEKAKKAGFRGFGRGRDGILHLDIREFEATWFY